MMQRIDKCKEQLTAKLLFETPKPNHSTTTLNAFSAMLYRMVNMTESDDPGSVLTQEDLLNCPRFSKVTYNASHVITGFTYD